MLSLFVAQLTDLYIYFTIFCSGLRSLLIHAVFIPVVVVHKLLICRIRTELAVPGQKYLSINKLDSLFQKQFVRSF